MLLLAAVLPRIYDANTGVQGFTNVPKPGVQFRMNAATATTAPWVDANGWRFERGLQKAFYNELPRGSAALAAAEAFAYGVEAVIRPDPADAAALQSMLDYLRRVDAPAMPAMADIGVIDDGTPAAGELMNLLARRNLLYRIVKTPDARLALTVRPSDEAMKNPAEAVAHIREKLSDEKRLLRIYGSSVVLARLTGDGQRARLHLLNYGRQPAADVRVRLRGAWGAIQPAVADVDQQPEATEFTIKELRTYAVVDLEKRSAPVLESPRGEQWSAPAVLDLDYLGHRVAGKPTLVTTRWSDKDLYFRFECPYDVLNLKPEPQTATDTDKLWDWDVAEAFIGTEPDHIGHYKEFEISPRGEWVDLDIDRDHPQQQGGEAWNSGFRVSARIDSERRIWYGEMRIPFASLGIAQPRSGLELRLNLYRCAGRPPERQYSAWNPTGQKSFHVPQAFGTLRLR